MPDTGFLGTGASFPFAVNPATGRVEISEGKQSVKESIFIILKTTLGERIMRSEFGTNLNSYTFMELNPTTLQMLRRELINQITRCEPRVDDIDFTADNSQEGVILFNLTYTVREDNTPENLVFPFYLESSTEPEGEGGESGEIDYSDVLESAGDYASPVE